MSKLAIDSSELATGLVEKREESSALAQGLPGLICLTSELDHHFPEEQWAQVTHGLITELMDLIQRDGIYNHGLFSGLTGIAQAVHLSSCGGERYSRLIEKLNRLLVEGIKEEMSSKEGPLSPGDFDVIGGASGMIPYLLHYQQSPGVADVTKELLSYLVALVKPIEVQGWKVGGWYIAPEEVPTEERRGIFPNGYLDTGLAHGIAGSLLALSHAALSGVVVEGQMSAIREMTDWLQEVRVGSAWPGFVKPCPDKEPSDHRDGWCYGAPGIAHAIYRAGIALDDPTLCRDATEVMRAVSDRFFTNKNLNDLSLCHGWAGLLTMLHHFALETNDQKIARTVAPLSDFILSRPMEDDRGLLTGTTGVLLSLLFAGQKERRPWTEIFMLF